MKEFLLLLGDPRFQVGDAVGTGDFVERLAVGAAAVAGDFDVALLGFPKELLGMLRSDMALAKLGDKRRSDPLEVDVVFPERVVGIHQESSPFRVSTFAKSTADRHGLGFRVHGSSHVAYPKLGTANREL